MLIGESLLFDAALSFTIFLDRRGFFLMFTFLVTIFVESVLLEFLLFFSLAFDSSPSIQKKK